MKEELDEVTIVGYTDFLKSVDYDITAVCGIKSLKFEDGEKEIKIYKERIAE